MKIDEGVERVLQGEPLAMLSVAYREGLLRDMDLDPEAVEPETFGVETRRFVNKLCRHLGDRHAGDARVAVALEEWVWHVEDYEPWDALLSGFDFAGKERLIARGRNLFPGPLTAHWQA